jgi:hypothetical protein
MAQELDTAIGYRMSIAGNELGIGYYDLELAHIESWRRNKAEDERIGRMERRAQMVGVPCVRLGSCCWALQKEE